MMLSRIMENYERTGDNEFSTAEGLESTGGLITSATLILAVVVGAFVFTDNEVMKAIGLGLTAAILLDATVIRVACACVYEDDGQSELVESKMDVSGP